MYIPISSINKLRNEVLEKLRQSFIEHKQLELINYEQEQFNLNNDLSPLAIVNNINQEQFRGIMPIFAAYKVVSS